MKQSAEEGKKIQAVKEATSFLLHKHYCENDVEAIIDLFDDKLSGLVRLNMNMMWERKRFPAFFDSLRVRCPNAISGTRNTM